MSGLIEKNYRTPVGHSLELFGGGDSGDCADIPDSPRLSGAKKTRGRGYDPDADGFVLEPHCCRHCMGGRLASRPGTGGRRKFVCTNCGVEAEGADASALCCCGMTLKRNDKVVDAGLRCHANEAQTPEWPSLYVASYRP